MWRSVDPAEWAAADGGWQVEVPAQAGAAGLEAVADWRGGGPAPWLRCAPASVESSARVGTMALLRVALNRPPPRVLRLSVSAPPALALWRFTEAPPADRARRRPLCRALDAAPPAPTRPVQPDAARAALARGELDPALDCFARAWLAGERAAAQAIAAEALAFAASHPLLRSPKLGAMVGALAGFSEPA